MFCSRRRLYENSTVQGADLPWLPTGLCQHGKQAPGVKITRRKRVPNGCAADTEHLGVSEEEDREI